MVTKNVCLKVSKNGFVTRYAWKPEQNIDQEVLFGDVNTTNVQSFATNLLLKSRRISENWTILDIDHIVTRDKMILNCKLF